MLIYQSLKGSPSWSCAVAFWLSWASRPNSPSIPPWRISSCCCHCTTVNKRKCSSQKRLRIKMIKTIDDVTTFDITSKYHSAKRSECSRLQSRPQDLWSVLHLFYVSKLFRRVLKSGSGCPPASQMDRRDSLGPDETGTPKPICEFAIQEPPKNSKDLPSSQKGFPQVVDVPLQRQKTSANTGNQRQIEDRRNSCGDISSTGSLRDVLEEPPKLKHCHLSQISDRYFTCTIWNQSCVLHVFAISALLFIFLTVYNLGLEMGSAMDLGVPYDKTNPYMIRCHPVPTCSLDTVTLQERGVASASCRPRWLCAK